MSILSESQVEFEGKIIVRDPINVNVLNKLPVGVLELKFQLGIEYGRYKPQPNQREDQIGYEIEDLSATIYFGNVPLTQSFPVNFPVDPNMSADFAIKFKIDRDMLTLIESSRVDDLGLSMQLAGRYSPHTIQNRQHLGTDRNFVLYLPWKFSQKEWGNFLKSIGFAEKWIIEIERPRLEGFHEVVQFIEKAQNGFLNRTSPDAIISDLRSAWDRIEPYIKKFETTIKEKINAGSEIERNEPSKDERIAHIKKQTTSLVDNLIGLRRTVDKLTQIGPHKELYTSTVQDAILSFRLTVSLMAYYSQLLVEIEKGDIS